MGALSPREIVQELDKYIVGQDKAKRAVAIALDEVHPEMDPTHVNFVDLRDWVMALEEFDDDPQHSGEKILEAIQMAWIEERE